MFRNKLRKVDYALACETLKFIDVIKRLLDAAKITSKILNISNEGTMYVMIYDLLFGTLKISGGGAVKRKIVERKELLESLLSQEMKTKNVTNKRDLLSASVKEYSELPYYIRINELKMDVNSGMKELSKLLNNNNTCKQESSVQQSSIKCDEYIPSLVALPAATCALGEHPMVKDGSLIIQDKASCFPSQILLDRWMGGRFRLIFCIDVCI